MILSFDKFERYEVPQVTLCNPNSRATEVDGKITITDTVGVLSNPSGMNLKLNFNAPHELSFDYYRHKSSDPIKQSFYDSIYEAIQTDRYIYLTDIGYFTIKNSTDSDEDNIDKKSISLKSCEENELATSEGLHLKEGTYYLHTENNDGLLDLFLPKTAGWTIGYIDPSLLTKPYFVEETEIDNGYNFLYTTIQDMYECIVEPDIIKRTISVYSRTYYAEHHLTDIHIAKYNLLKHKIVEENDEDKYTALNVQGKDENLEIRTINPTGKNVIYNFEPRYSWMSFALQQAIEKWQEKCESVEEEYLTLQQCYYTEQELVFNKQKDIEVLELGLKQLESTRDFITSGAADNYLKNIKLYCTQYNSNVNGNVDYAKRPFISPEEMVLAGYPEFSNPDEEVATTYDCDYAFMNGSGSVLYTIKMTPIIEDRTVLSVEGLDAYYDAMASSCSTKEQLLAYDAAHSKLIINIANGDTPRDSEGLTTLDKILMPIKNNHWATVKAFMKAAGLDMTNLSNVLNEIENRQTALSHVNSAITTKQSEINKATSDYNAHESVVHTNYEEPINQINKECALDITAIDINGNSIFTTELLNELMTHIKPTDYVDEYMLVTEFMSYSERFEKAKELMDRAQSQLIKISSGQKTYSIDTRSFLFNKQFKHFSEQLCAGAIIYVEIKNDTMEQLHLTGIDINFDEKSTNFTLGNKYDRSDLKALYEDALGQNSKSFSELKYIASIIEDQQKQLDYQRNWVADLRTLTLDNVLTSEDQAIEINNRGLIGRKRRLDENGKWDFDENGNPFFEPEQVKLINNTLVFTKDNWNNASTAVGKIAVGYDDEGNVKYAYGINGQVLIGELILGNNLVLTGMSAGIKIKNSSGEDVFYADDDGNLVLSGTIFATSGHIGGWDIDDVKIYTPCAWGSNGIDKYGTGMAATGWSDDPAFYAGFGGNGGNPWAHSQMENNGTHNDGAWHKYTDFYVTNGGFLRAKNAEIDGTITATQGTIGGWTIDGSMLRAGINKTGTSYFYILSEPNSDNGYIGAKDKSGSWCFKVDYDGHLHATNADISGKITADDGQIGGWTIDGDFFYKANNGNMIAFDFGGVGGTKKCFAIGQISKVDGSWSNAKFAIDGQGKLYATDAYIEGNGTFTGTLTAGAGSKIGGWTLEDYMLYAGSNKTGSSYFYILSNPNSGNGYIGAKDKKDNWCFKVDSNGYLHATGATITGDITLNDGSILMDGVVLGNKGHTHFRDYGNSGTIWQEGTIDSPGRDYVFVQSGQTTMSSNGISVTCSGDAETGYLSGKWQISGGYITLNSPNSIDIIATNNIYITGTAFLNGESIKTSDKNAKNSITTIDENYSILFDNLRPVTYKYNDGTSDRLHTGFIAQEVENALKIANINTQDFAAFVIHNKEDGTQEYGLRYGEFIALNTWQIQKLKSRVVDLENTVAELKTQVQTLTAG